MSSRTKKTMDDVPSDEQVIAITNPTMDRRPSAMESRLSATERRPSATERRPLKKDTKSTSSRRNIPSTSSVLAPPEYRNERSALASITTVTPYNQRLPSWRKAHEEDPSEEKWSNRYEFVTACLGFTASIDTVMGLPMAAILHGRGSLIIAYIILDICFGIPISFFEVAIGQFTGQGPIQVFRIIPIAAGLGYAILIHDIYLALKLATINSHLLFYLFTSMRSTLPWKPDPDSDVSEPEAAMKFYTQNVLNLKKDISDGLGNLVWPLIGCLFLVCSLTFLGTFKSIKVLGKIGGILVPITFALLLILFFVVLSKSGSGAGLGYFLAPGDDILYPEVWVYAFALLARSKGLGIGINVLSGSFTKFQSPAHIDCIFVSLVTFLLGMLSCLFIFAGLGVVAYDLGVDVDKVIDTIGLRSEGGVVLVYSITMLHLPSPPFMSIVFFLTASLLGVTSMFALVMLFSRSLYAVAPRLRRLPGFVVLGIIFPLFLLTLPFVTQGGTLPFSYLTSTGKAHMIAMILEFIVFLGFYRMWRLRADIEFMLNYNPHLFYRISWCVTPFVVTGFLCYEFYLAKYDSPMLGLLLLMIIKWTSMLLPILLFAIVAMIIYYKEGNLKGSIKPRESQFENQILEREILAGGFVGGGETIFSQNEIIPIESVSQQYRRVSEPNHGPSSTSLPRTSQPSNVMQPAKSEDSITAVMPDSQEAVDVPVVKRNLSGDSPARKRWRAKHAG